MRIANRTGLIYKIISKILSLIIVWTFFSCVGTSVKISSADTYEVVEFPDGSIAYLNKNSSIEYDKNFDERVVEQQGEVFFIVTKGKSPFIVKTDAGEIKVLGTEFHVKSDKNKIEVEVKKGTVELRVDQVIKKISKGQKAIFNEIEEGVMIVKADLEYKQWMNKLHKDFRQLGKAIKKNSKQIKKETKKLEKEINKQVKKLKKNL